MKMKQRILLAEDDLQTALHLAKGLTAEGFAVFSAASGARALQMISEENISCIVLDWMLPDGDGLSVLSTLRSAGNRTPVLLLTARDTVADKVVGLEAGADDYLAKPFAFEELLARIRALLRRFQPAPLRRSLADLTVDFPTRRVVRAGQEISLTPREFDLLAFLISNAGETVDRDRLAREVWRETNRATPIDNVIDVHVARLRRKLDDGHKIKLLHVVRGLGLVLRVAEGGER